MTVMFMRSIAGGITQPIISIYLRTLGLSIMELGILGAGLGAGLLIFEPMWGVLADRGLNKKILIMSCIFMPLITFLYTVIRGIWELLTLMFFSGFVMSAMGVSSRRLTASYHPKRGRAFGLWYATMGLAGLIGPSIGGYLAGIEYALPFYVSAITSIFALFTAIWITEPKITVEDEPEVEQHLKMSETTTSSLRALISSRPFIVTSLLIVFPCFNFSAMNTFLPVYVKESPRFLFSEFEIGLMFTLVNVVGIPTQLLLGELSDRIGRKAMIILGMALDSLTFWLLPFISGGHQLYFTVAFVAVARAAVNPIMLALMVDNVTPSLQGRAIGIYGALEDLGILLGPMAAGYAYQYYGPAPSFHMCAVLMFFGVVCACMLLKKI
jgi:MFS family permease